MAIYTTFDSRNSRDNCSFCLEAINNTDAVAHVKEGRPRHPIHRRCAQKLAEAGYNLCPECRTPTLPSSLFTWKERCVTELKFVAGDLLIGTAMGMAHKYLVISALGLGAGIALGAVYIEGIRRVEAMLDGDGDRRGPGLEVVTELAAFKKMVRVAIVVAVSSATAMKGETALAIVAAGAAVGFITRNFTRL